MLTTTQAFDLEIINRGDLIVVLDDQEELIGVGIITDLSHWELIVYLYTFNPDYIDSPVERYRVTIEDVIAGTLKPKSIAWHRLLTLMEPPSESDDQMGNLLTDKGVW